MKNLWTIWINLRERLYSQSTLNISRSMQVYCLNLGHVAPWGSTTLRGFEHVVEIVTPQHKDLNDGISKIGFGIRCKQPEEEDELVNISVNWNFIPRVYRLLVIILEVSINQTILNKFDGIINNRSTKTAPYLLSSVIITWIFHYFKNSTWGFSLIIWLKYKQGHVFLFCEYLYILSSLCFSKLSILWILLLTRWQRLLYIHLRRFHVSFSIVSSAIIPYPLAVQISKKRPSFLCIWFWQLHVWVIGYSRNTCLHCVCLQK